MQENIITDRTIIDVMAFCELSKSMSKAEKDHINGVLWHLIREYDIIFHIDDLSVPMEDNGVRETDKNYRLDIHEKISSISKAIKNGSKFDILSSVINVSIPVSSSLTTLSIFFIRCISSYLHCIKRPSTSPLLIYFKYGFANVAVTIMNALYGLLKTIVSNIPSCNESEPEPW